VTVKVDFPEGIWTQWYPQAAFVGPKLPAVAPEHPRGGHLQWNAELIPPGEAAPALPAVASNALWHYSREVDSAYVVTHDRLRGNVAEPERFLFYRGLGQSPLPVRMTAEHDGTLAADSALDGALRHVFVIQVRNGRGVYRYLPELAPGKSIESVIPSLSDSRPLPEFVDRISSALQSRLVETGLEPREAWAMVHTWTNSYFRTDGIRTLFVMPQAWTDRTIPLHIDPVPSRTVRVMVGRIEHLAPERERRAASAVRDLGSTDEATRTAAFETLRSEGRYVEPILRRVARETQDDRARALAQKLLLSDWVTELRTSLTNAADGSVESADRTYLRAQLASLLRQIGEKDAARTEGQAVLTSLQSMRKPERTDPGSRHYLRAWARAKESLGDPTATAQAYEELVRFGGETRSCHGCHQVEGPRNMAWFRDWWAGKKLAEYLRASGQTEQTITREEQRLKSGTAGDATRLILAYLYESRGDQKRTDTMWAQLTGTPVRAASR
jgi:hypothetical protein